MKKQDLMKRLILFRIKLRLFILRVNRIHNRIFVLVGLLVGTEVDRMPHIFGLGENLPNDITAPVIRVGEFLFAFPNATPLLCGVDRRSFHRIVIEDVYKRQ